MEGLAYKVERQFYRYVPHPLIDDYRRQGYIVVSWFDGAPQHAQYACLMKRVVPRFFQYLPRVVRALYLARCSEYQQCLTLKSAPSDSS